MAGTKMMSTLNQIIRLICVTVVTMTVLISCTKKEHEEEHHTDKTVVNEMGSEIQVPRALWAQLEKEKPLDAGSVTFMPISLELVEKNSDVLSQKEIDIQYSRGGGDFDFSRWMGPHRGTFKVKFGFEVPVTKDNLRVFFVSQARKRKIDNELWGAGCNKFFEITNSFFSTFMGEGFVTNSTRQRHLSVLGGDFIFILKLDKTVKMAKLSMRDSENSEFFCEPQKVSND